MLYFTRESLFLSARSPAHQPLLKSGLYPLPSPHYASLTTCMLSCTPTPSQKWSIPPSLPPPPTHPSPRHGSKLFFQVDLFLALRQNYVREGLPPTPRKCIRGNPFKGNWCTYERGNYADIVLRPVWKKGLLLEKSKFFPIRVNALSGRLWCLENQTRKSKKVTAL